jgi:hypothetical protein
MSVIFSHGEWHHSPVWINAVTPMKTGHQMLRIDFHHAAYSDGVQSKVYDVKVLRREAGYVLSDRDGLIVIWQKIDRAWIESKRFAYLVREMYDNELIGNYLDRRIGRPDRYADPEFLKPGCY